MRLWLYIGAALAVLGAAAGLWAHGWATGHAQAVADNSIAVLEAREEASKAAEEASRTEAARLAAEAERDELARQLEDAANAEPPDSVCRLPLSRVLRLNSR